LPPPPYSWTGFYIGANIGADWTRTKTTASADPIGWLFQTPFVNAAGTRTLSDTSVIGGVQAGYNWQYNVFVAGIEADISGLNANETSIVDPLVPCCGGIMIQSFKQTVFATLRPRIGVAFDRTLVYATGGLAVARFSSSDAVIGNPPITRGTSTSEWRAGWTVGGGLEYAFAPNWSGKIEYLYSDFGSWTGISPNFPVVLPTEITFNHRLTNQVVRGGINYKFNTTP
jgi:outer membrane immunogenic protein